MFDGATSAITAAEDLRRVSMNLCKPPEGSFMSFSSEEMRHLSRDEQASEIPSLIILSQSEVSNIHDSVWPLCLSSRAMCELQEQRRPTTGPGGAAGVRCG